jgi:AcrR family transcriptional regulator
MPRTAAPVAEPPAAGLRERKKERVREQLIEAAVKLFSRKGFDATTIDDIVGAVEVSRRTFFRYFDTKEDVLPAWFDRHVDSVLAMLDARPGGEAPMVSLRHVLDGIADLYESRMATVLSIERVIGREPSLVARRYARMDEMAERLAKRLAARGRTKDEAYYRLLSRVALAIASSAIERWVTGAGKASLSDTMRDSYRAVDEALAAGRPASSRKR